MSTETLTSFDVPAPQMGRRRRFSNEEKRRFLAEASRPGESISAVGRRYGLSVSLLFRWKRQLEGSGPRRAANVIERLRRQLAASDERIAQLETLLEEKTREAEDLRKGRADVMAARLEPRPAHVRPGGQA